MSFEFFSLTKRNELFNKPDSYGIGFIDGKYIVQIQKDYVDGDKPHAYYSQETFDEFEDAKEVLKKVNSDICVEETVCWFCRNIIFADVSGSRSEEYENIINSISLSYVDNSWRYEYDIPDEYRF